MHEKPVKLAMSFDEALLRLSKVPRDSVKPDTNKEKVLEKAKLKATLEQQGKTTPPRKKARLSAA